MAGGAVPRVQPVGAFGLQISDRAIDCLLNLLGIRGGNRSRASARAGVAKQRLTHNTTNEDVRAINRSLAMRVARHGRRVHHILTCLRLAVLLVQSSGHRGNDDLQVTERVCQSVVVDAKRTEPAARRQSLAVRDVGTAGAGPHKNPINSSTCDTGQQSTVLKPTARLPLRDLRLSVKKAGALD